MTMPAALIMHKDANGPGARCISMGKVSVWPGRGRRRKKIHPNKINHDSSGREEERGRAKGREAAEGLSKARRGW